MSLFDPAVALNAMPKACTHPILENHRTICDGAGLGWMSTIAPEIRRVPTLFILLAMGGACSSTGSPPDGNGGSAGDGASGGAGNASGQGPQTGGTSVGGTNAGGQSGTAGGLAGMGAGGSAGSGGTITSGGTGGGGSGGAGAGGGKNSMALEVLTDTNRDGVVGAGDSAGFNEWSWKGSGAFLIANVDDDDDDGEPDASDRSVNGQNDETDLAPVLIRVSSGAMASATSVSVSVTAGAAQTHLFEKTNADWRIAAGPLSRLGPEIELGIEAIQFADASWDGIVTMTVTLSDSTQAMLASQEVTLRVAPWIMLPQSAKTEMLYISSRTSRLRPDLDSVLESAGLPRSAASNPGGQDIWFQDTMEIGYTQIPGRAPLHVVMEAQRPNASDDVAPTLLAPNFGFISVGSPRQPANEEDHWMDWMGNLEVTHPVPEHPLGRIYYGKSDRTTFHPTILEFLKAQQVQEPFDVYTDWLVIQHVDEVMNFLPDPDGKAKMIIVSPAAANEVMGSGYDSVNRQIQTYIDAEIAKAKVELGLSEDDIIELPTFFEGNGTDFVPKWSNPVNSVLAGRTFMIGDTDTPAAVKADVEQKLGAIGIDVAWVDDSEYHPGGGNVHCGTNTKKTPVCANFATCLPSLASAARARRR
jgi:hypothetical protein